MFERYTEQARRTIFFARYEASQFGSKFIDTEHLLLGAMRENAEMLPVDPLEIRRLIEAHSKHAPKSATSVDLPLSQSSKEVLMRAAEEADELGHRRIDVPHLLLGLLRVGAGLAHAVLAGRGVKIGEVRSRVTEPPPDVPSPEHAATLLNQEIFGLALLAMQEAKRRNQLPRAAHLLLAILSDTDSQATWLLEEHGVTRETILELIGGDPATSSS